MSLPVNPVSLNPAIDDCLLWKRLKSGDETALDLIYDTYVDHMFRFGKRMIANGDFVQDCIHDIFVDLWRYRSRLAEENNNIKIYLFKALSNKIQRQLGINSQMVSMESAESSAFLHFTHSIEDDIIQGQRSDELKLKLYQALDNLPIRQKEVLLHLFFENFTYGEISETMGINVSSVYTLAWKAINNLKKSMLSVLPFLVMNY